MYALAERLHKTVPELLDGKPRPLTKLELARWMIFQRRRSEPESPAQKRQRQLEEFDPWRAYDLEQQQQVTRDEEEPDGVEHRPQHTAPRRRLKG